MTGSLLAIDWQAGVAWSAIMFVILGGLGVLVGIVVIVVRARFFTSSDDDLEERRP